MMLTLLVLVCLLTSFVLGGCEAALLAVSRVRVRHAAAEGDRRAVALLPMLHERDAMLGAVTVANHVTSLTAFLVLAWKLVAWQGPAGYAVAFLLGLPVFLIGLEIVPKKLFRRYPFRMLKRSLWLLRLVALVAPVFGGLFLRRQAQSGGEVPEDSAARDDLKALCGVLCQNNQISASAAAMIRRVLDYRRLRVSELMVPLRQSMALAQDMPVRVAVELARNQQVESVPVLGEGGHFVGVFEPALCGPRVPGDRMVRQYMRPLEQIREEEPALRALQRLRKRGRTVALVLREDGTPAGVLTEQALLQPLLAAPIGGKNGC